MIRKLERWAWWGGAALAVNGGMVNAVGLSSFARQTISHVTGTTTLLSLAFVRSDYAELRHLGTIFGSFILGAAVAGFVVHNAALGFGRRYAAALWIESGLLLLAARLIPARPFIGLDLAAAACGLQNAMASTYSGAVLRTTHMTGIVTDLGAALGHLLGGMAVDWIRVRFYGMLLASFVLGAMFGGLLFARIGYATLDMAVGLTAALALGYTVLLRYRRTKAG